MSRLLLVLAMIAIAPRAEAYSFLWGSVSSAHIQARAGALRTWEGYPWIHDVDFHQSNTLGTVEAHTQQLPGWADAGASASTIGVSGWGRGVDSEPGGSGDGTGIAKMQRLFKVIGGTGSASVSVDLAVSAYNDEGYADVTWSAGVIGVSSLGGHYTAGFGSGLDVSLTPTWSGILEYGRTYAFEIETSADGFFGGDCFSGVSLVGVPRETQPIPEPATWALLGFGLLPLLRRRRSISEPRI